MPARCWWRGVLAGALIMAQPEVCRSLVVPFARAFWSSPRQLRVPLPGRHAMSSGGNNMEADAGGSLKILVFQVPSFCVYIETSTW
jgi:hypothetical protein